MFIFFLLAVSHHISEVICQNLLPKIIFLRNYWFDGFTPDVILLQQEVDHNYEKEKKKILSPVI